jgi:ATP synthase protein I
VIAERPTIDPETKKLWRIAGSTGAVGIEVAVAIAIGYLGGHWLDGKFHTSPWLTLVGFVAGIGAAAKALVRVTRAYQKKDAEDTVNEAAEKPSRQDRPDAR